MIGEIALLIKNKKYALGSTLRIIPGQLLEASIRIDLASDFSLVGKLRITREGAGIIGTVTWDVPGKQKLQMRTSARIDREGIRFEPCALKIGKASASMYLRLPGKRYSLRVCLANRAMYDPKLKMVRA